MNLGAALWIALSITSSVLTYVTLRKLGASRRLSAAMAVCVAIVMMLLMGSPLASLCAIFVIVLALARIIPRSRGCAP